MASAHPLWFGATETTVPRLQTSSGRMKPCELEVPHSRWQTPDSPEQSGNVTCRKVLEGAHQDLTITPQSAWLTLPTKSDLVLGKGTQRCERCPSLPATEMGTEAHPWQLHQTTRRLDGAPKNPSNVGGEQ